MIALAALSAAAWVPQTTPDGVPVAWEEVVVPWRLATSTAPSASAEAAIREAVAAWNAVDVPLELVEGAPVDDAADAYDGTSTIGFLDTWTHGRQVLAVTRLWAEPGGRIREFDVFLQARPPGGWSTEGGSVHLPSAVLHELGHALGLGHSDVDAAAMFAVVEHGEQRRVHADDELGLQVIYADLEVPDVADSGGEPATTDPGGCQHTGASGAWLAVLLLVRRRCQGAPSLRDGPAAHAGGGRGCTTPHSPPMNQLEAR